jgi:hypothetical protein
MTGGGGKEVFFARIMCFWMLIKSIRWCRMVKVLFDLSLLRVRNALTLMGLYALVNIHPVLYQDNLRSLRLHPGHRTSLLGSVGSGSKC